MKFISNISGTSRLGYLIEAARMHERRQRATRARDAADFLQPMLLMELLTVDLQDSRNRLEHLLWVIYWSRVWGMRRAFDQAPINGCYIWVIEL